MYRIVEGNAQGLADVDVFLELLNDLPSGLEDFFDSASEILVTRAPGRLDVMGGIADYSGSMVLPMPIAEATFAAIQKNDDKRLKIISLFSGSDKFSTFELDSSVFSADSPSIDYNAARRNFESDRSIHWASYAAGVFFVLRHELGVDLSTGVRVLIASNVPVGKGVSSSAALEVATMQAVCAAFDIQVDSLELALFAQKVENEIVGAPCGVMDQVASHCGSANSLISMRCQPAELLDPVRVPQEVKFGGIDSGVRHSVSGSDYSSVRAGTFIGYRIIADVAGLRVSVIDKGLVAVEDDKWNGYLADISPERFEQDFSAQLPDRIRGSAFLDEYGATTDKFSRIDPNKVYSVKAPTAHAIYENFRVTKFAELLQGNIDDNVLEALGRLMYESHAGYTACGLGASGTDRLVELARQNRANGVFGARITGGGSGGTVVFLARTGAEDVITDIAEQYGTETGKKTYSFRGSSPGCVAFGYLKLGRAEASVPRVSRPG